MRVESEAIKSLQEQSGAAKASSCVFLNSQLKRSVLNLTTERCPMTFVKVKVALHEMREGEVLEVLLRGESFKNVQSSLLHEGYKILSTEYLNGDIGKITILTL